MKGRSWFFEFTHSLSQSDQAIYGLPNMGILHPSTPDSIAEKRFVHNQERNKFWNEEHSSKGSKINLWDTIPNDQRFKNLPWARENSISIRVNSLTVADPPIRLAWAISANHVINHVAQDDSSLRQSSRSSRQRVYSVLFLTLQFFSNKRKNLA